MLVAEDDVGLRSVLERGLRENGYVVDAVADGEWALRFLRTYDYEVAVLDWRMPVVSGIEVVRTSAGRDRTCPCSCSRPETLPAIGWRGSTKGPTTTWSSPSTSGSCLPASERSSAALRPCNLRAWQSGTSRSIPPVARCTSVGRTRAHEHRALHTGDPHAASTGNRRRRTIALHVWDDEADALGSNTIDVHMARLRAKIGSAQVRIETVRGMGYRIVSL